MRYKTLQGKVVNIADYAVKMVKEDPNVRIYIGTDSQNFARKTTMVTVIAFRYSNNRGVHVIFNRENVRPKIRKIADRLRDEVERTIMAANWLEKNTILKFERVEFDLNSDPQYKSNGVLSYANGWAKGMGYDVTFKPDEMVAVKAANDLCHK